MVGEAMKRPPKARVPEIRRSFYILVGQRFCMLVGDEEGRMRESGGSLLIRPSHLHNYIHRMQRKEEQECALFELTIDRQQR